MSMEDTCLPSDGIHYPQKFTDAYTSHKVCCLFAHVVAKFDLHSKMYANLCYITTVLLSTMLDCTRV